MFLGSASNIVQQPEDANYLGMVFGRVWTAILLK